MTPLILGSAYSQYCWLVYWEICITIKKLKILNSCDCFKKEPSMVEVINNLDSDIIIFYRVVQNHLEEFLKQFKWLFTSREWFQDWKNQLEVRGLTDIQRAARYYYIQRLAFGGKVKHRSYGVQIDRAIPRINILRIEEEMSTVHLRLAHVRIENLTWQNLIKRYDKPDTFFYCDPPYYKGSRV